MGTFQILMSRMSADGAFPGQGNTVTSGLRMHLKQMASEVDLD